MITRDAKQSAWEQMAAHVAKRLERNAQSASGNEKTADNSSVGTLRWFWTIRTVTHPIKTYPAIITNVVLHHVFHFLRNFEKKIVQLSKIWAGATNEGASTKYLFFQRCFADLRDALLRRSAGARNKCVIMVWIKTNAGRTTMW